MNKDSKGIHIYAVFWSPAHSHALGDEHEL
jgi:hypothetical protein